MYSGILEEQEYDIIITGYVYALWNKDESDVFYIGATQTPHARLLQHRQKAKVLDLTLYRKVLPEGVSINMTIIEEIKYPIEKREWLNNLERYWISKYLLDGYKLKNKQLYTSVELTDIPNDVMEYILKTHKELFKNKITSRKRLEQTVIYLLTESMKLHNAGNP